MQQKQTFSAAHTGYYNAFYCLLNDKESISNSAVHFSIQWSLQFRTVSHMYSANHRFFNLQQTYCHGHPHQKHEQIYYFFIHLIIYTFFTEETHLDMSACQSKVSPTTAVSTFFNIF